ncbi:MAG: NAD(P)(+) transhydrogenase (Re/Si-specific) subunit alpha, partial [Bacteroidetes bacterium]
KLITASMRKAMRPGSVLVDLAAETGGNCEETLPGQTQVLDGITLLAPLNLPATLPVHASQMLARNLAEFLGLFRRQEGPPALHTQDDILKATCLLWQGNPLTQLV